MALSLLHTNEDGSHLLDASNPIAMRLILAAVCLLLALPLLGVLGSWLRFDAAAWAVLTHQAHTVLPDYALQSLALALGVAVGVAMVGSGAALSVSLFEFPGRKVFEWALLLPLAMPAYVLAYAYTDLLQFSGPVQSTLRGLTGATGPLWPDVRSLPGAMVLLVLALYPYVYLLMRTALAERAVALMEAADLLGASLARRVRRVALPLARPALVAGVALALMETLADYGVGAYFGLSTLSTGIYRAWLVMNDTTAAAQLASLLLLMVALLLWAEQHARRHMQFAAARGAASAREARRLPLHGQRAAIAWLLCALPIALGFVLPVLALAGSLWGEMRHAAFGLPWARFAEWAWASLKLSGLAAGLAAALALALLFTLRTAPSSAWRSRVLAVGVHLVGLGYAVPGAVVAIGWLLWLGALQTRWPSSSAAVWVTGSIVGLLLAYLVRFAAVALQTLQAGYSRLPATMDQSAQLLGASRLRLLHDVHLPLLRRSMFAAVLLVFVDVMKELPATLVLRPFGSDTLAVVAYNLARDERLAEAALPSLAIVAVGLLPVLMLMRAMRSEPLAQ
jgi:iron(III) transport system permease protein